jgi:hypothetical protein
MHHSNTEKLIAIWRSRRVGRRVPTRSDLSPVDLGALLPQVFMLGRSEDGDERFRLSGGLMSDLHGADLRNSSFYGLWSALDRPQIASALARCRATAAPIVVTADACSARGDTIGVELCLAPLLGPNGELDRTLGLYQPISTVARLIGAPVQTLTIRQVMPAEDATPVSHLRLVVDNTQRPPIPLDAETQERAL